MILYQLYPNKNQLILIKGNNYYIEINPRFGGAYLHAYGAGVNFIKDFGASIRNIIGGRSSSYEGELIEARENALRELSQRASKLGADAVVGIDIDYEVLGETNGMLMVTASGTAVKLD